MTLVLALPRATRKHWVRSAINHDADTLRAIEAIPPGAQTLRITTYRSEVIARMATRLKRLRQIERGETPRWAAVVAVTLVLVGTVLTYVAMLAPGMTDSLRNGFVGWAFCAMLVGLAFGIYDVVRHAWLRAPRINPELSGGRRLGCGLREEWREFHGWQSFKKQEPALEGKGSSEPSTAID